jgi:hypothetical protein
MLYPTRFWLLVRRWCERRRRRRGLLGPRCRPIIPEGVAPLKSHFFRVPYGRDKGTIVPSFRALSGRLKSTVPRYKFKTDSPSSWPLRPAILKRTETSFEQRDLVSSSFVHVRKKTVRMQGLLANEDPTARGSYGTGSPRRCGPSFGRCVSLFASNPCTAVHVRERKMRFSRFETNMRLQDYLYKGHLRYT